MSGARGENEEAGRDDSRAVWERPAVRRMSANEAQSGVKSTSADKKSHNS
jgi:hypothetical protein